MLKTIRNPQQLLSAVTRVEELPQSCLSLLSPTTGHRTATTTPVRVELTAAAAAVAEFPVSAVGCYVLDSKSSQILHPEWHLHRSVGHAAGEFERRRAECAIQHPAEGADSCAAFSLCAPSQYTRGDREGTCCRFQPRQSSLLSNRMNFLRETLQARALALCETRQPLILGLRSLHQVPRAFLASVHYRTTTAFRFSPLRVCPLFARRAASSACGWSPRSAANAPATEFVVHDAAPNCVCVKPERGAVRCTAI